MRVPTIANGAGQNVRCLCAPRHGACWCQLHVAGSQCARASGEAALHSSMYTLSPRACEPVRGDSILVLKESWLTLILQGVKTLEVRPGKYRAGKWYLGTKGMIFAQCTLGHAVRVETLRQWRRLQKFHRHSSRTRPYGDKTHVMPILSLHEIRRPYYHPRGAIGVVRYVPTT